MVKLSDSYFKEDCYFDSSIPVGNFDLERIIEIAKGRLLSIEVADCLSELFLAMYPTGIDSRFLEWDDIKESVYVGEDLSKIQGALESIFGTVDILAYVLSYSGMIVEINLKYATEELYSIAGWLDAGFISNPFNGVMINFCAHGEMTTVRRIPNPVQGGPVDYVQEIAQTLKAKTLTELQAHRLYDFILSLFYGKIGRQVDWSSIKLKAFLGEDQSKIIPAIENFLKLPLDKIDQTVFVSYISPRIAYMQTDLQTVLKNFDELRKIPLNKYIFNPFYGYMIELRHVGDMRVGVVPKIYYRQFADTWWHGYGEVE